MILPQVHLRKPCSQNFPRQNRRIGKATVRIIHRITRSVGATGGVYKGQGQLQKSIPDTMHTKDYPTLSGQDKLDGCISVARVQPRTSKGITDLSPSKKQTRTKSKQLVSRLRSRSLTELTRQITPPTKNGHAPPPKESRKSYQSVNPYSVWTW
ncbi:hypothetical protein, conserved [Babesia bigemina]|uniref:Uncharacterized protein n=1 Tax=Babesia bigemina TaxID=5866 RepID=A0A061D6L4_BABBI|nr:hypothetical protein, conserved [Babesia bigemina]CDR95662.1 hypothetical protein, conserved [Babesia bigemina]|eukprot:XP_012767848.1 hypothetical protein, conserved [Babesia bigemina]